MLPLDSRPPARYDFIHVTINVRGLPHHPYLRSLSGFSHRRHGAAGMKPATLTPPSPKKSTLTLVYLQVESSSITTRNGAIQREMQDAYRKLICANVERKVRTPPHEPNQESNAQSLVFEMEQLVMSRVTGCRSFLFVASGPFLPGGLAGPAAARPLR